MLTYRQQGHLIFIQGQVCLNTQDISPKVMFEIYTFEVTATSLKGQ